MTLSTMDAKAALVMIGLQKGVADIPAAHPVDEIVQRAAALATALQAYR